MRQFVFTSVVFIALLHALLLSSKVLGQQQVRWTQVRPSGVPAQFAPLPVLFQNSQGVPKQTQKMSGQKLLPQTNSPRTGPLLGGKVHLLSTLWNGLRNTGLEASIAGDILERVVKVSLRDLIVPFKRDVIFPLVS